MWMIVAAGVALALFYIDSKVSRNLAETTRSDSSERRTDP